MILAKLNYNEILASSVTLNYETNKELTVDDSFLLLGKDDFKGSL